jgi:hypothetical protein
MTAPPSEPHPASMVIELSLGELQTHLKGLDPDGRYGTNWFYDQLVDSIEQAKTSSDLAGLKAAIVAARYYAHGILGQVESIRRLGHTYTDAKVFFPSCARAAEEALRIRDELFSLEARIPS